jgi:pyruvate,water dikinase
MEGMEEIQDYDPNVHLLHLHELYCQLNLSQQEQISAQGYAGLSSIAGCEEFHQKFEQFIERFGHLSNSGNDFSVTPWRESLDMLLNLIKDFRKDEEVKANHIQYRHLKLVGIKRWWVGLLYRRARQYRLFREQIGSLYTLGYGKFRPYFLELGRRMVERGLLNEATDIFYLDFAQVRQIALGCSTDASELQNQVACHKEEIKKAANIVLPTVIYGDEAPPIQPLDSKKLTGIPSSRGYYCGKVKVVRGIEDFPKLEDRDVLVIPFTDVGWTPLFARAGAVISESGGMLAHSSIVAREYHIPAVVSVQGAMQLVDGMTVAVDGYRGEVTILETADS